MRRQTKTPPLPTAGLRAAGWVAGQAREGASLCRPTISDEAEAREAEQHHRPGRRLRHSAAARGTEQPPMPMVLRVHALRAVQGDGSPQAMLAPEIERYARERVDRADELVENRGWRNCRPAKRRRRRLRRSQASTEDVGGRVVRRTANLKDVRATARPGSIVREVRRRSEEVDAGREGKAAEVPRPGVSRRQRFGGIVRRQSRRLGPPSRRRRSCGTSR